jgi:hypothetical protein
MAARARHARTSSAARRQLKPSIPATSCKGREARAALTHGPGRHVSGPERRESPFGRTARPPAPRISRKPHIVRSANRVSPAQVRVASCGKRYGNHRPFGK